ncbi:MAG: oxidoreductase [Candidatus Bipolaricaulota bacterium]
MAKPKLAMYWTGGCGGCDVSPLEVGESIVDVLSQVELVFWPALMDAKRADVEALPSASIDAVLINGALRTEENVEMVRLLRKKAKVVVAYGACAHMGGIIGLGNLCSVQSIVETALGRGWEPGTPSSSENGDAPPLLTAGVVPLADVIQVDYTVPGCPPPAQLIGRFFEALLSGEMPSPGHVFAEEKALCDQCPREKEDRRIEGFVRPHEVQPDPDRCLLDQGIVCMGPVTRGGCEAACAKLGMPCTGCLGPTRKAGDVAGGMISALASLVRTGEEGEEAFAQEDQVLAGLIDPVGTLYKYALATAWKRQGGGAGA